MRAGAGARDRDRSSDRVAAGGDAAGDTQTSRPGKQRWQGKSDRQGWRQMLDRGLEKNEMPQDCT